MITYTSSGLIFGIAEDQATVNKIIFSGLWRTIQVKYIKKNKKMELGDER